MIGASFLIHKESLLTILEFKPMTSLRVRSLERLRMGLVTRKARGTHAGAEGVVHLERARKLLIRPHPHASLYASLHSGNPKVYSLY